MRTKINKVIKDLTPKKDPSGGKARAHKAGNLGGGGGDRQPLNNPEFPPFLPQ